jgi:hypothetical protein
MVIEKPPPAQPAIAETKPPPATSEPVKVASRPPAERVARKEAPAPPVVNPQPATADAPPLEPANSSQQQASIQRQVSILQRVIGLRIARLAGLKLSGPDRKTLEDARTFIAQSEEANKSGDLSQASNLAQKAQLLVQAIEKRY